MSLFIKFKTKKIFPYLFSVLVLAGCASRQNPPPCPKVFIEKDTASLTSFGNNKGRDITDKELYVQIDSFGGSCSYNKDLTNVDVTISPVFIAEKGMGAKSNTLKAKYFTAIPKFFPNPNGKFEHDITLEFPAGNAKTLYRVEPVTISIPLSEGETGLDYDVYIGMQLTKEQLEYNRK
ncbi:MAG: hypothetical protein GY804_01965 [Alphaproteobacteria bacterium]|nr:hypothetical protein [Alphaproteobacteria bacterium]